MESLVFARLLAVWLTSLFSFPLAAQTYKQPKPPHIVIILVGDIGYGDAICYNAESKIATPHINRIAEETWDLGSDSGLGVSPFD